MGQAVPFKEGILTRPLSPVDGIRLSGVKCRSCGALTLGKRDHCINCTSTDIEDHIFSKFGKIYSYTVVRASPPPPYPRESFKPFPVAWVELDDGLYILSEIICDVDDIKFELPVELIVSKGWEDENGNDVLMYKFKPTGKEE
jgi:uncharacterized OB-fold protein